jgi:Saxitoxin biosynthesis operon protein SxtJ
MRWIEDVRASLARLDGSPRALRRFGLTVGGVLAAFAAWLAFRERAPLARDVLAGAATLLLVAGVALPGLLRTPYRVWMALAFTLGWVMSRVALTVLFALVVTPLAVVARLSGKRFLGPGADPAAASAWARREPRRASRYDKMY